MGGYGEPHRLIPYDKTAPPRKQTPRSLHSQATLNPRLRLIQSNPDANTGIYRSGGLARRMPDEAVARELPRPLPDNAAGVRTRLDGRKPGRGGNLMPRKRSDPRMAPEL